MTRELIKAEIVIADGFPANFGAAKVELKQAMQRVLEFEGEIDFLLDFTGSDAAERLLKLSKVNIEPGPAGDAVQGKLRISENDAARELMTAIGAGAFHLDRAAAEISHGLEILVRLGWERASVSDSAARVVGVDQ